MNTKSKKAAMAAGIFFALFLLLLLALRTVDVQPIGPAESSVGLAFLNGAFRDAVGFHPLLYKVTQLLGVLCLLLAAGFGCLGVLQLIRRRSIARVDADLYALGVFYIAVMVLYVFFELFVVNCRPILTDEGLEASFPSSHTMLALFVCGSGAFQLNRRLPASLQKPGVLCCAALGVLTALGRLVSGVHWFTDILGGLLLASSLLSAYVSVVWALDRFQGHPVSARRIGDKKIA